MESGSSSVSSSANLNGGIWSYGNALISTTLVSYLAQDLGATGFSLSCVLASPHLVGTLRLFTPRLLSWIPDRKWFSISFYLGSCVLLSGLTWLPWAREVGGAPNWIVLAALVVIWAGWHVLMYVATIALWSLLRDLAPRRELGSFWSKREVWMISGTIAGSLLSSGFLFAATKWTPNVTATVLQTRLILAGAIVMAVSVVPLISLPSPTAPSYAPVLRRPYSMFLGSWTNREFARWLAFHAAFSLANGLFAAPQNIFPKSVLKLSLGALLLMQTSMRIGQVALGPAVGQ